MSRCPRFHHYYNYYFKLGRSRPPHFSEKMGRKKQTKPRKLRPPRHRDTLPETRLQVIYANKKNTTSLTYNVKITDLCSSKSLQGQVASRDADRLRKQFFLSMPKIIVKITGQNPNFIKKQFPLPPAGQGRKKNSQILTLDFLFPRENAGPCLVVIYRIPTHQKNTVSSCLPYNVLAKDALQEVIAEDVDTLEETNYLTLGLLGLELLFAAATLTTICVKKYLRPARPRLPRVRYRRDPVNHVDFEAVRI